ncbi:WXG100-like domain-containing protein [Streptomyces sp. NPDC057540]|uniref:WXG100-like domain-containing protein n=1 Tax=Streptomyces sp. NPDC057540 TaxID=3346160 RepID=UPI0036BEA812
MALERSDADKGLMDLYALPWVEANEDDAHAAAQRLRPFGTKFTDDRADAGKAVERLVSSGQGEAVEALQEHWTGLSGRFAQVSEAAGVIADGLDACGDIARASKNAVLDLVVNLRTVISPIGAAEMPSISDASQQAMAAEAEKARPRFVSEVASAATRGDERVRRAREAPDVVALKAIAGRPAGGSDTRTRAADSMHLASATSSWFGGDLFHDEDEHARARKRLGEIADHIRDTSSLPLAQAGLHLTELGASGALGASLAAGLRPLLDDLVLASRALADHLTGSLSDAIKAAAEDQKRRDDELKKRFGWMR